ncbi:Hypothetical protein GbCGDNIH6_0332 [Granulibacter bethesdensis]|uniref:Anti-sigma factor NepR domain-containing protein n=1 Tax=Granulibacter bethesdensis TaxID=364410 RepID=A0AAN0RC49_9PROT|nr:Hypothetical protein GbCGDNIH3_0332 [Granulibacter bethesdensis]AHJ64721.1 Hypothetical protein GbCGDNIH4_0332 [Granulibacter bethesdensis CGDNIH4]APH56127.1 Hypothetical protein GbCGDNIH6_0332 [Granulibacter bethesdensis]APH58637.1 Hypothetical protein GbCGDNIH7_0332 [Granulibacter bethesdensis]
MIDVTCQGNKVSGATDCIGSTYHPMMAHYPLQQGGTARPSGGVRKPKMAQDVLDLWVSRSLKGSLASVLEEPLPDELRQLVEKLTHQ